MNPLRNRTVFRGKVPLALEDFHFYSPQGCRVGQEQRLRLYGNSVAAEVLQEPGPLRSLPALQKQQTQQDVLLDVISSSIQIHSAPQFCGSAAVWVVLVGSR